MALVAASCSNDPNYVLPPINGGSGTVISLRDGGVAGGGHGGAKASGTGGAGGGTIATGGIGGGAAGASGAAGNGAAGSAVVDDACTACEKARCSHPMGLTSNTRDPHNQLVAEYEICFLGTGWPTDVADPSLCGNASLLGTKATSGPAANTPKTSLCQDLLKCIHQTNCVGSLLSPDQAQCYCGPGVSAATCQSPGFTPTGVCKDQFQAALEFDVFTPAVAGMSANSCYAEAAALAIVNVCDTDCCSQECFGVDPESVFADTSYCNAPGSGGATGTGGSPGTGGAIGTGGSPATGGAIGTGGSAATGGAIGTGGSPATGGAIGTGGSGTSTGGAGGAHGGTTGSTGGASGSGGTALFQNGQFDTSTTGWTLSYGATATRSPMDAAGNAQSGSLDLTLGHGDPTISVEAAASQCVSATGGSTYGISAQILIPANSSSAGAIGFWFYTSSDCSGAIASAPMTPSSATNGWQMVKGSGQAPAGVHSMAVRLELFKPIGQTAAEALFDAITVTAQ